MSIGNVNGTTRGSGARLNTGKAEWHQLPLFALEGVIRVLEYGAGKYAPGNWMRGQAWTVPFNCAMRHLAKWQRGEDLDPESGLPHLDHALTNLMFLSAYRDLYTEGDDRWKNLLQPGGLKDVRRPQPSLRGEAPGNSRGDQKARGKKQGSLRSRKARAGAQGRRQGR